MRNLLFTIAYDGGVYHGWQVQANSITVQQTIQNAIEKVLGERGNIIGCSRTDTGVHANRYCFNMRTDTRYMGNTLIAALNAHLPGDIAVLSCEDVEWDFHARYDCVSKEYIYRIWNSPVRNPFLEKYALHYKYPLDEHMLAVQAADFIGTHDFTSFCSAHSKIKSTVRTVEEFRVERVGDEIVLTVIADGFLYNMVRIMVGTLLKIAQGKILQGSIPAIIEAKSRSAAGTTAPAHGLYLNSICYEHRQKQLCAEGNGNDTDEKQQTRA